MAQKSGFFNALKEAGLYDRKYNASDYSDNLAVIISDGVLRSNDDDLKVTASGLELTVNIGRAWIKGHYYKNTTQYDLPAITLPTGASRIDRVVLRLDNSVSVRDISLQYLTGEAATSPVPPALTRNDTVYDLCLANITVQAGSTSCTVEDTRGDADVCGWVYSVSGDGSFFTSLDNSFEEWFEAVKDNLASVTLFKRYAYEEIVSSATTTVSFNIPQYDADTCFIEVYVNGILSTDYTQSGTTLTFTASLDGGTEVIVYCYKSIDGTGIMTVSDEITELQNEYAAISGAGKFVYTATGTNDNISLSQIAQAFLTGSYDTENVTAAAGAFLTALGGNTYLGNLDSDAKATIEVVGKLGITTAAAGSGTEALPYIFFNIGSATANDKRLTFDFSKADRVKVPCASASYNVVFYGTNLDVRNCDCIATATGSDTGLVQMIKHGAIGEIKFTDCKLTVVSKGDAIISEHGDFTNCICYAFAQNGDAFVFSGKTDTLIRVYGGKYYAYKPNPSYNKVAAVFFIPTSNNDALIFGDAVSCPSKSETGYSQQYLALSQSGHIYLAYPISILNSSGGNNSISHAIQKSKE